MSLLGLMLLDGPANAQQAAGSVVEEVKDESGGMLPSVSVTATSPALHVPQVSLVTTGQGEYCLTPLPIGIPNITEQKRG